MADLWNGKARSILYLADPRGTFHIYTDKGLSNGPFPEYHESRDAGGYRSYEHRISCRLNALLGRDQLTFRI